MKVYTKTGDRGTTSLIGGERVFKNDARVEAYGSVDELTAFTALLCDKIGVYGELKIYVEELRTILCRLMSVEALLAKGEDDKKIQPLPTSFITDLEQGIDRLQAQVQPITKFTIPSGHELTSLSHVCRTVCRRAERAAITAHQQFEIDPSALMYLNRLSDYFYLLGRRLTEFLGVEEILWIP